MTRSSAVQGTLMLIAIILTAVAWTLSSPIGSSPDEEAHIAYSWGTATGQTLPWTSVELQGDAGNQYVRVTMPATLRRIPEACYKFKPEQTACAELKTVDDGDGDGLVTVASNMARYPFAYYLLAGAVMRVAIGAGAGGILAITLARAISGIICGLMAWVALRALRREYGPELVIGVGAVMATPMVLFLCTSINPNGFEVMATALVASTVVALRAAWSRGEDGAASLHAQLVVAALFLGLARPASVIWLGLLLCVLILPIGGIPHRLVWKQIGRRTAIGLALVLAVSVAWFLYEIAIRSGGAAGKDLSEWQALPVSTRYLAILLHFGTLLRSGYTDLRWADTAMPMLFFEAWLVCAVVVLVIGFSARGRRVHAIGGAIAFAALSTAAVAVESDLSAFAWQGRYYLPVVMGTIVLLSGASLPGPTWNGTSADPRSLPPRTVALIASMLSAVIAVAALFINVCRYVFGFAPTYTHFPDLALPDSTSTRDWVPLLPIRVVLVVGAVGVGIVLVSALRALRTKS